MNSGDKKKDFVRKLNGDPIEWKAYAMRLLHAFCQAEMREKEFCAESRYFYNAEKELAKDLGLTDEDQEFLGETYMTWLEENKDTIK